MGAKASAEFGAKTLEQLDLFGLFLGEMQQGPAFGRAAVLTTMAAVGLPQGSGVFDQQ